MKRFLLYCDSGTTNTRMFLLDQSLEIVDSLKKQVGSRECAINGDNRVLIEGLFSLYSEMLAKNGISDSDIEGIYISGNVTCSYGIKELPYVDLPVDEDTMAGEMVPFLEETLFKRDIWLMRGVKSCSDDISLVGTMRGEEPELIGIKDFLSKNGLDDVAVILPGSHTHVAHMKDGKLVGCISNFTGELFFAIKEDTMLSPILSNEVNVIDSDMVRLALENLDRYGFNHAIHVAHIMKMTKAQPLDRISSYAEAVINGGVRKVLEDVCKNSWKTCKNAVVLGNAHMYELFSAILKNSEYIMSVECVPALENGTYALEGFRKIYAKKVEK